MTDFPYDDSSTEQEGHENGGRGTTVRPNSWQNRPIVGLPSHFFWAAGAILGQVSTSSFLSKRFPTLQPNVHTLPAKPHSCESFRRSPYTCRQQFTTENHLCPVPEARRLARLRIQAEIHSKRASPTQHRRHDLLMASSTSVPLPSLPCEIIEAIAQSLSLRDRVALVSSCRALWAEPDLVNSVALFGDVTFDDSQAGSTAKKAALAGWLSKRRAACHSLQLSFCGLGEPASLLAALEGSPLLSELRITPSQGDLETCPDCFLGDFEDCFLQLRSLNGLTSLQLRDAGLGSIPQHVTALSNLAALDLSGQQYFDAAGGEEGSDGGLALLAKLPDLTRLELRGPPDSTSCLAGLPLQLSALPKLKVLDLSLNEPLGELEPAAWAAIQHLTALTRLALAGCGLAAPLPPQLACLKSLEELDLSGNDLGKSIEVDGEEGGDRGRDGFEVLLGLPALRTLDLSDCGLEQPLPYSLLDLRAAGVEVLVYSLPLPLSLMSR